MRISSSSLGVFVPGRFVVPQNPVLDGMGDFVPGRFTVPQNPIRDALGDTVPTSAMYPIPQNSVLQFAEASGMAGLGCGCGGKCGCDDGCGGGMGDISADFDKFTANLNAGNFQQAMSDTILSVPALGWLGGLVL